MIKRSKASFVLFLLQISEAHQRFVQLCCAGLKLHNGTENVLLYFFVLSVDEPWRDHDWYIFYYEKFLNFFLNTII